MKTLALASLAIAGLTLSSGAQAQSVGALGSVLYRSSYLSTEAVGFGDITPGTTKEVLLTNTTDRGYIGVEFNSKSVVTFTSSGTLTQTSDGQEGTPASPATVAPTYYCAVVDDTGDVKSGPGVSTTFITGTSNTSDCFTGNTVTLDLVSNKKTTRWIVIGGKVLGTDSADLPSGSYSGSVTISIAKSAT